MNDPLKKTAYGYVDTENNEYVITDLRTPRPWFNYMWNERYGGLVSHTGGGFSFLDSPRDNRLTRMRYNSLPWDRPGRTLMLRDQSDGEYWSLSWAPTMDRKYDHLEARHGLGYTRISTLYKGVRSDLTYFVPMDLPGEIWRVHLENKGSQTVNLDLFAFAEVLMGNALNDQINQPNDKHFTDVHFNPKDEVLEASRRYWVLNRGVSVAQPNLSWPFEINFFCTQAVSAFDGSLDKFIGRWRSESNPITIEKGQLGNSEITAGDAVMALQTGISLEPGQSIDLAFIMAIKQTEDSPVEFVAPDEWELSQWNDIKHIDAAFDQLRRSWEDRLSGFAAETPDPVFNQMTTVWNPYQSAVTFDMARNAGYYHGGLLFGTGMRDQFQDILGVLLQNPDRVRARLLNALQFQFADGSTLHNYFKYTGTGERTHHSDTPLWIPFGIIEYLKETGDVSLLDVSVNFHDSGNASVLEHLILALRYALSKLGTNGLPLMMNGDWNDTLDKVGPEGRGETVWGAAFLGYVLDEAVSLFKYLEQPELSQEFQTAYTLMKQQVNAHCWDGDWFLRAFRDDGRPLGTHTESQGQIFLNAQSWAVISGFADENRGQAAMAACLEHLRTPYGMQICWPAYREVDASVGLISRCVPGKKENASVFNHASAWFVMAALKAGLIEDAVHIYSDMLPLNSSENADQYELEPYAFAEYVTSPEHETSGQASHSWLTGSAVWMLKVGRDHILGIQANYSGLRIDPKIPSSWDGYAVTRKFRDRVFNIKVENPQHLNQGVTEIRVNHVPIDGLVIDPEKYAKHKEIDVLVRMG